MATPQDDVRVRIAPSPTGALHLGLARTALFNWAYARGRGGTFVLRLEDTDRARSTKESELAILEGLHWLGIDWDEGPDVGGEHAPYHQSQRIERHREYAARLLEQGAAYPCFCSAERLTALREQQQKRKETARYDGLCRDLDAAQARVRCETEPFTVRFRVPEGQTRFVDLVRGEVVFQNVEVDDWVMVRQDGNPTYNFVVVCDDADMRITHVLRGEEHLVNTPKQILLYRALDLEPPRFAHLPLMLGANRKKLSKRDGSVSLTDYRELGYPREAIVNFLCLQGWALDGETEVFSVEELVEKFDVEDVSKGGAIFDFAKFKWLAGEYVHADTDEHLAERCAPFVIAAGLLSKTELAERHAWYLRVVGQEKERIRLYAELPGRIAFYFAADDQVEYDPQAEKNTRKRENRVQVLTDYLAWLGDRALDDPPALSEATKAWIAERELRFPDLFQPLRCALTGLPGGPDLFEVIALLGPESTRARIQAGIQRLA